MTIITTIDDFKPIYKRRVPKMFYDYCESGSWTEQTFRENVSDFSKIYFKQKVAVIFQTAQPAQKCLAMMSKCRLHWHPLD